jgi:hypothetical protein
VTACVQAEQAYGPRVVYRLPYAALIDNPESAVRSLLDLVGEPYSAKCLEPLGQRINSSNVPIDFVAEDPATDPGIVKDATRFWSELQETPQASEPSSSAADAVEATFHNRVEYIAALGGSSLKAARKKQSLECAP